ncbi:type IV pilus assembly protein, PilZ family [Pseudomonas mucidolens]|nr:type IV pilus assembly protein, PilZ family [Pseudomonas mucidolens]
MSGNERGYAQKRDFIRMRVDADVSLIHAEQNVAGVCVTFPAPAYRFRLNIRSR